MSNHENRTLKGHSFVLCFALCCYLLAGCTAKKSVQRISTHQHSRAEEVQKKKSKESGGVKTRTVSTERRTSVQNRTPLKANPQKESADKEAIEHSRALKELRYHQQMIRKEHEVMNQQISRLAQLADRTRSCQLICRSANSICLSAQRICLIAQRHQGSKLFRKACQNAQKDCTAVQKNCRSCR